MFWDLDKGDEEVFDHPQSAEGIERVSLSK
jgi:hypothetical protein